MKPINTMLFMVLIATSSFAQSKHSKTKTLTPMQRDEIAVNILKTLEGAWNKASGADYAKPFADTCEFVDIRGTLHQQSTVTYIGEAHQGIFNSIYKDSKIAYELKQTVAIDPNAILVNAASHLEAPSGPLAGNNSSTLTLLLLKEGSEWKIRALHNTLVAKR